MGTNDFDKQKTLDTINQWIFNCDTKASIVLATLGIFLTILFSSSIGSFIANTIKDCLSSISVCNIIFLLIFVVGAVFLSIGIYKLICVLMPKINLKHRSVMFFGYVSEFPTFEEYKKTVDSFSGEELTEDILHQIYAASKICYQKFENQKQGLRNSFLGVVILLMWLILGFFVYFI